MVYTTSMADLVNLTVTERRKYCVINILQSREHFLKYFSEIARMFPCPKHCYTQKL